MSEWVNKWIYVAGKGGPEHYTKALYKKHWRINDIKEGAIKSYWISQVSIITGTSGFGWGNAGRKGLTLNSVMEDTTCNLSSERIISIWKVEKIVVDREWVYCSTVLLMLFKVVCVIFFLINLGLYLFFLPDNVFQRHWSRKGSLFSPCRYYHLFHLYSNLLPGSKYSFLKWEIKLFLYLYIKPMGGNKGLGTFLLVIFYFLF